MKAHTLIALLCFLLIGTAATAQKATILDLEGVSYLDITQVDGETVDFGVIEPGTLVRKKMGFKNTYSTPIILHRVLSEPGCFTSGTKNNLREITIAPGENVEFFVMSTIQIPGSYDIKNELILEIDGKKVRRSAFQFKGFVEGASPEKEED